MKSMRSLLLILVALLTTTCAKTPKDGAPRDVAIGVDVCEYCHMSVDDLERAAQWVEPDGNTRIFDEPGCLVAWLQKHPDARGHAFFADTQGSGWIPAAEATFIRGASRTAMGFDVLAYRDRETAASIAAQQDGVVLTWTTLREEGVDHAHAY